MKFISLMKNREVNFGVSPGSDLKSIEEKMCLGTPPCSGSSVATST